MINTQLRRRGLMGQGGDDNYIHFADPEVERICLANWDSDHDGKISYEEALAVTSITLQFAGNTQINSFEEIKYFGIQSITDGFGGRPASTVTGEMEFPYLTSVRNTSFYGVLLTALMLPKLVNIPDGDGYWGGRGCFSNSGLRRVIFGAVETIGVFAFQSCTNLTQVTGLDRVTSIKDSAFRLCSNLQQDIVVPELTTMGSKAFSRSGIVSIFAPKLTVIVAGEDGSGTNPGGVFSHTYHLNRVYLRDVSHMGYHAFWNSAVSTIIIDNSTPPSLDRPNFPDICQLYVPDSAVDTYKADATWSAYASRIHGISELPD